MKILLLIVPVLLFTSIPVAAENSSLEITADLPSVPVYIDDNPAGTTPLTLSGISEGYHLVRASPEGFFSQTQNISVQENENAQLTFSFLADDHKQVPAMVRIGDCVGTPEPSDLDGPAYDLIRLADGTLMAYYSGWEEGILCMKSSDGISWEKLPDSCLDVTTKGKVFTTDPWVFSLPDGTFRMIFRQTVGSRHSLYSGTSQDGIHFSDEEPVFIDGDDTEGMPGYPSVPAGLSYDNGTIRMYYSIPSVGIKSARSEDRGATWVKEEGVRIHYGTDPTAILLADGRTGLFYVDTTPKSKGQRIFFAVSDDGIDFSIAPPMQVLETIEPGVWLMDPEVIRDDGKTYLYFSVMGVEGMQHRVMPGTLRSIIDLDCLTGQ